MDDLLLYRAYKTIQMPDGVQPLVVKANEVVAIPQSVLMLPSVHLLIQTGALRAEPAMPAPVTETVIAGMVPTASEIIEALQDHPTIYEQVKQHFARELRSEMLADSRYHGVAEAPSRDSGFLTERLPPETARALGELFEGKRVDTGRFSQDPEAVEKRRKVGEAMARKLGESMSTELTERREAARRDQVVNGGPLRAMAKLFGLVSDGS